MSEPIHHALSVFLGFFAIMNPIANTAIFVGLTGEEKKTDQIVTASKALIISFFIILAFALLGKTIFHYLTYHDIEQILKIIHSRQLALTIIMVLKVLFSS